MTTAFKTVKCRACGAYIIFLPTLKNKTMPVNADTVKPGDLIFDRGKHHSHFDSCPKADQFRKQVKKIEAKASEKPEPTGEQIGLLRVTIDR